MSFLEIATKALLENECPQSSIVRLESIEDYHRYVKNRASQSKPIVSTSDMHARRFVCSEVSSFITSLQGYWKQFGIIDQYKAYSQPPHIMTAINITRTNKEHDDDNQSDGADEDMNL